MKDPKTGMETSACKGCGRTMLWMRNAKGRLVPVDPGRVTIIDKQGAYHSGYVPHHSTCPHASDFRKEKGGAS